MSMAKEFKEFISRGNVMDLAIGLVIGAAFGKIVTSFVQDVLTPPIGLALGGVSFNSLKLTLGGTPEQPVTLNYGAFLQTIFDFLIIAFAIFLVVKAINAMRRKEEEAPAPPTQEETLLTEIRDILKETPGRAAAGRS